MASSSSSSFDVLESAINELDQQLRSNVLQISGWFSLLNNHLHDLHFFAYLRTILICIHKSSDTDEVAKILGSLPVKVEAAFQEIAGDLNVASQKKYIPECPSKLHDVLHQSRVKVKLFKHQIEEALGHLSGCSLVLHSASLDYALWFNFIFSIEGMLHEISSVTDSIEEQKTIGLLKRDMKHLQHFLHGVLDFEYGFPSDPKVNSFLTHLTSVAVCIANWSLQYWIIKRDSIEKKSSIVQLQDLLRRIYPTTPEVLELNLNFLRALNKICNGPDEYFAESFLFFLLAIRDPYLGNLFVEERRDDILMELSSKSNQQYNIFIGLRSLIIYCISTNEPEEHNEDVQIILYEIKALLIEAGLFFPSESDHPSSEWQEKICLLQSEIFLKQQLKGSTIFVEGQFEDLKEVLTNLNYQSSALIVEVYREISSLYQSVRQNGTTEAKARISLFTLLSRILLFKVNSSCMELLKDNECSTFLKKDHIQTLLEGLKWFATCVTNDQLDNPENVELILTGIEAVSTRVRCLHHTFLRDRITEEMINKTILSFSELLDNLMLIKPELRKVHPQIQRSNFPKICGMGFIDDLIGSTQELLKHDPDSIALVKHQIEEIHSGLTFLRSFFMDITEPSEGHDALKDLGTSITDVACEVEYVIDFIEVGTGINWKHVLWLYDLLEEIRLIKMMVTNSYEKLTCYAMTQSANQISRQIVSQFGMTEINEEVVVLNDQAENVIVRLMRGTLQRDVVSIVGMPGIGKTTLAKKVYNDPNVAYHFHIRAWCSVSQGYQKRNVLLDILGNISISGLMDNMHHMRIEDLEVKLYQHLKQKRYLIVMDDVWGTESWSDLQSSLPNDGNGSRILITSRLHDVALKVKPDSDPLCLRLLSEDESWKLLRMKILHGGCSEELQEVGKKIAKRCEGLPLAIVAVAGLLARTEKNQDRWERIAESLSSKINDDPQSRCKDILQLSYNHLPDRLKACFLYMGAFVIDKDIPVRKLTRLWIAEGFIQGTKSLEDIAEAYLMDLIGRNLVMLSKRRSMGGVKTCRVHDILHDFCLAKATEENFLQLIARKHFVKSRPSSSCARSLILFPTCDTYPRHPYDISFIALHFKLLRVLDLENINMGVCFPTGIELLIQLTYLAVSGDIDSVPQSIADLWKLETLIVKGLKDEKIILPDTIWCMVKLRHVVVNNHVIFISQDDKLGVSSQLDNLVTFSTLSFSSGKDTGMILQRLPNLRKLGCIFMESRDSLSVKFPELDTLTRLESLKMVYIGRPLTSIEFNLPLNLKKLTLSNFRLPWDHISAIGKRLQNLEVLKLLSRAFEGQTWDMREGEFIKLKYLMLDTLSIAQWNATSDHLPNLEQLVLRNCKKLEEVPFSLGEITTLQMIEVQSCKKSTEESAIRIGKEGWIEGLKIIVNQSIHV
nr:putative late blight resistance protein homolog R1B-8 isoform X1 [Coffea arabica]